MAIKHQIRVDGNEKTKVANLTARQVIMELCKECVGFNRDEVRRCTDKLCALFPFRTHDTPENTV